MILIARKLSGGGVVILVSKFDTWSAISLVYFVDSGVLLISSRPAAVELRT